MELGPLPCRLKGYPGIASYKATTISTMAITNLVAINVSTSKGCSSAACSVLISVECLASSSAKKCSADSNGNIGDNNTGSGNYGTKNVGDNNIGAQFGKGGMEGRRTGVWVWVWGGRGRWEAGGGSLAGAAPAAGNFLVAPRLPWSGARARGNIFP